MDAQQFAYWLQGFVELSGDEPPTPAQWKSIRDHLGLVFQKVTPPVRVPQEWGMGIPLHRPATAGDPKPLQTWCSVAGNDGFGTVALC